MGGSSPAQTPVRGCSAAESPNENCIAGGPWVRQGYPGEAGGAETRYPGHRHRGTRARGHRRGYTAWTAGQGGDRDRHPAGRYPVPHHPGTALPRRHQQRISLQRLSAHRGPGRIPGQPSQRTGPAAAGSPADPGRSGDAHRAADRPPHLHLLRSGIQHLHLPVPTGRYLRQVRRQSPASRGRQRGDHHQPDSRLRGADQAPGGVLPAAGAHTGGPGHG